MSYMSFSFRFKTLSDYRSIKHAGKQKYKQKKNNPKQNK